MAETKKFVDLTGLDYFWEVAQGKIATLDAAVLADAKADSAEKDAALKTTITQEYTKAIAEAGQAEATTNAKMQAAITALETTVGDDNSGLVKEVATLRAEVDALGGVDGGIDGMIDTKIAALDLPNTYEAKGEAAKAEAAAKKYADDLAVNYEVAGEAAKAEAAAKKYTDGLNTTMSGRVDALEAQDEYVAADVTAAINKAQEEAQSYADGLNTTMSGRVDKLEDIDHEAIAAQAAADAVAAVVANAPEDLNTLKEVADYIAADKTKASEIETAISNLGQEDSKIRGEFAAADAQVLADAKADAAELYQVKGNYETAGTAAAAIEALKLDETYEAKGAAADALDAAKADATTKANAAQAAAEATAAADATSKANAAQAAAEATAAADATSKANAAQAAAEAYADAAVAGIVTATNDEIDAIFA